MDLRDYELGILLLEHNIDHPNFSSNFVFTLRRLCDANFYVGILCRYNS